jgi:hypothetical protein
MSVKILLHPGFAELVQLSSTMKRRWKREGRWEARVEKGLASGVQVVTLGYWPPTNQSSCAVLEDG